MQTGGDQLKLIIEDKTKEGELNKEQETRVHQNKTGNSQHCNHD